jgi:predicted nucleic acid-binding Zn ribbon protein
MSNVYTCTNCAELFHVVYLSGTFPGGKDRESIDCPSCGTNISSEVTSAVITTKALSAEDKSIYQAEELRRG